MLVKVNGVNQLSIALFSWNKLQNQHENSSKLQDNYKLWKMVSA